jgi:hypothetical protein
MVDALRRNGIERRDPVAGQMVVTAAVEDAEGQALAVVQARSASIESP